MNVKLQLGEVCLLIDKRISLDELGNKLQPMAKQANLLFAEHRVGLGYLQWTLPGSGWTAFSECSDSQKTEIAQIYKERKTQMQNSLQGSFLKDIVFSVPSEEFIFFRYNGNKCEIAITAWGYKYIDRPACGEIDTYVHKQERQEVNIAFTWAGQIISGVAFKFSGHMRTTTSDGFMHVDGLLPVGSSYSIETLAGYKNTLIVEKGRSDYVFDLTQYYQVEVVVYQDNELSPNCSCDVRFGENNKSLVTDGSGRAQIQFPLLHDSNGQVIIPQPPCVVTCGTEIQQQVPLENGEILNFEFKLSTRMPEPPLVDPPMPSNKQVRVKIEAFRGDEPIGGLSSEILYEGKSHIVYTDERGEAFYNISLTDGLSKHVSKDSSICKVRCADLQQSKVLNEDVVELVFHFDIPTKKEPDVEPEYVNIQLRDYEGFPLKDMPFNLITRKKGCTKHKTDQAGECRVPKEWFTPKEKIRVEFSVSSEYQRTHDIHNTRSKKKN